MLFIRPLYKSNEIKKPHGREIKSCKQIQRRKRDEGFFKVTTSFSLTMLNLKVRHKSGLHEKLNSGTRLMNIVIHPFSMNYLQNDHFYLYLHFQFI